MSKSDASSIYCGDLEKFAKDFVILIPAARDDCRNNKEMKCIADLKRIACTKASAN